MIICGLMAVRDSTTHVDCTALVLASIMRTASPSRSAIGGMAAFVSGSVMSDCTVPETWASGALTAPQGNWLADARQSRPDPLRLLPTGVGVSNRQPPL